MYTIYIYIMRYESKGLLTSNSIFMAILMCGCFCWALPRFCCFAVSFAAKRKSGWGICGSLLLVVGFLFCLGVMYGSAIWAFWVLFTQFFTAYAIVRTEPSALSATPEEKKKEI